MIWCKFQGRNVAALNVHLHTNHDLYPGGTVLVRCYWNQKCVNIHNADVSSVFFATSTTSVPGFLDLVSSAVFGGWCGSESFPFPFDLFTERGLEEEACGEGGFESPSPCARSFASLSSRPSSIASAIKSFLRPKRKKNIQGRLFIARWSDVPR